MVVRGRPEVVGGPGGPPPRRGRWVAPFLVLAAALLPGAARGAGGTPPTTCSELCPGLPDPCVVAQTVNVVPGSVIDCGSRAVVVSGGDLLVHDGLFVLKAGSVEVKNQHAISSDCPQGSSAHGFTLEVEDTVTIPTGSASGLRARCGVQGGVILIDAGGAVTIAGTGIDASGTAQNAPGGRISISAGGALVASAPLKAGTTGGIAPGGQIELQGQSVTIGDDIVATGSGEGGLKTGGTIAIGAEGDLTVTDPGVLSLDATSSGGDGGHIELRAGGTLAVARPLRVQGTGQGAAGGEVDLWGERVRLDNDITATGGSQGGSIVVASRGGTLEVGTGASAVIFIDASGNNGGPGGSVSLESEGNDVVVAGTARIEATDGGGGGEGGSLTVAAVSVDAQAGSRLIADGGPGLGGTISIEARDQMTLSGTVRATDGSIELAYRSSAPVLGSGVACPCTQIAEPGLAAPCGDGVRREGVEECDEPDLGGQSCNGTLRCTPTCTLDWSGCA